MTGDMTRFRNEMYLPAHEHPDDNECVGCDLLRRLTGTTLASLTARHDDRGLYGHNAGAWNHCQKCLPMIPQDTDPLRDRDTDREPERRRRYVPMPEDFDAMPPEAFEGYIERIGFAASVRAALAEAHPEGRRPYSGWSTPRPWYRRLAAWVRRG